MLGSGNFAIRGGGQSVSISGVKWIEPLGAGSVIVAIDCRSAMGKTTSDDGSGGIGTNSVFAVIGYRAGIGQTTSNDSVGTGSTRCSGSARLAGSD